MFALIIESVCFIYFFHLLHLIFSNFQQLLLIATQHILHLQCILQEFQIVKVRVGNNWKEKQLYKLCKVEVWL